MPPPRAHVKFRGEKMNCGHSDVLGKIDLKRRETTACARGAGGRGERRMVHRCSWGSSWACRQRDHEHRCTIGAFPFILFVVSRSAKWGGPYLGGSSWNRPQGPNPGHLRDCWGCLGRFLGRLGHRTTAIVRRNRVYSWGRKISGISAWRSEGFFFG